MSDKFTGNWLVTEYVHNPDGQFVGIVHQKRRLQQLDNAIRVIQDCEVSPELANHPMNAFAGHWEFDIRRDGRFRRYLGRDVVGLGVSWGENFIEGTGKWPRFGYDFDSFSLMVSPERQLTGGTFSKEQKPMAVIIGVACPEIEGDLNAWPHLNLEAKAPKHTKGKIETFNSAGETIILPNVINPDNEGDTSSKHYSCYSENLTRRGLERVIEQVIIDGDNCYKIRSLWAKRPILYQLSFLTKS